MVEQILNKIDNLINIHIIKTNAHKFQNSLHGAQLLIKTSIFNKNIRKMKLLTTETKIKFG
jgi:hypothetical protein